MRILVCFPFVASEKGSAGGPTETVPESKQQVTAARVHLPGIGGSGGRMFRLSHVKAGLRAGSSLKRMQHGPWWCYSSADWGELYFPETSLGGGLVGLNFTDIVLWK